MEGEHFEALFGLDHMKSQDVFLIALLNLMQEKRYEEISVSELCSRAELSRNTFYKYFPKKDALLEYLKDSLTLGLSAYVKVSRQEHPDARTGVFELYFSYWYQLREWADVLIENGLWEQVATPGESAFALHGAQRWDAYDTDEPDALEMMHVFVSAGFVRLLRWWSEHHYEKTPEQMAELVIRTLSGHALLAQL